MDKLAGAIQECEQILTTHFEHVSTFIVVKRKRLSLSGLIVKKREKFFESELKNLSHSSLVDGLKTYSICNCVGGRRRPASFGETFH